MTLICPHCQARLQVDDAKAPSRPLTVRCPKCRTAVKLQPPISEEAKSAAEATAAVHFERAVAAPRFILDRDAANTDAVEGGRAGVDISDVAGLLAHALASSEGFAAGRQGLIRAARNRRRILVCAAPAYREAAARLLAEHDYEVFLAEDSAQALGRMREQRMDLVLLDANFDPQEQGTAFVMREIKMLRPAERRRLFLVYMSPSLRTLDLHAAFLHNVNLVFNPADLDELPEALEICIRNYNELYRDFNQALNAEPI